MAELQKSTVGDQQSTKQEMSEQASPLRNRREATVNTTEDVVNMSVQLPKLQDGCASKDDNAQDRERNQAKLISVVINHALSGELVAEVSLPPVSTIQSVKEHLAEQGHPLQSLILGTHPLDDNACLEELLLITGDPILKLQTIRMAKRRVQLAGACGRSSLGWLCFQGPVPGLGHGSGHWLGLEMDDAFGDCDGTYNGVTYFVCKPRCGLFVKPVDVRFVDDEAELQETERVTICGRLGKVCFRGNTKFSAGEWVGIELEDAIGKNNGCVQGIRYFWCATNHGMFFRSTCVQLQTVE